MKNLKLMSAVLFAVVLSSGAAFAFHDGGVADCAGCHTMHNSQDGIAVTPDGDSHAYLLKAANSTDACLLCHAGYGQFADGFGYGPGGDFYWVTQTWSWSAHGRPFESLGDSHGHNVISPGYGIAEDATLANAPGGDFLSARLTCTSCHDPHGNQNFRILYDDTMGPIYNGSRYDFDSAAPLALGNSRKTIGSDGEETDSHHTVYKNGMSDWCANCHETLHSDNTIEFVHPTQQGLGSQVAGIYNNYVSSDDLISGTQATAYWGLVPFEDVDADLGLVDPGNYTRGPDSNDQVMCVSCHRAHATPFDDIARWDMGETFIADSHPQDGEGSVDDVANKYYNYTFVQNQRSLCNKCHAKDAGDAPY